MSKRLIDFSSVKEGLRAYFEGRYGESREPGFAQRIFNEKIESLSKKSGIPVERIKCFFGLVYWQSPDFPIKESDYPTSVEFDKMMFVDKCDDEAALKLQNRLNDEFQILLKEKQSQTI